MSTWLPRRGGRAAGGEEVDLYVEAASNPDILGDRRRRRTSGDVLTAGSEPLYRVRPRRPGRLRARGVGAGAGPRGARRADAASCPPTRPRRWRDPARPGAGAGRPRPARRRRHRAPPPAPCSPACWPRPPHASAHRITAVGHAHIDSAWLWPLRETVRKVARTVSNVTALMDEHPELRLRHVLRPSSTPGSRSTSPRSWTRMREKVADGPVRARSAACGWSPTPTCPAARRWPGSSCTASGSSSTSSASRPRRSGCPTPSATPRRCPQLVKLAGVAVVPHPEDLLEPDQQVPAPHLLVGGHRRHPDLHPLPAGRHLQLPSFSGEELAHAVRNFAEKGAATRSLVPFGYGDGGGGPTREMLARARAAARPGGLAAGRDRDARRRSSPRPRGRVPGRRRCGSGELYLELHRATYTTQAKTKQGNRRSEHLLREAELWAATAAVRAGYAVPVRASWTGSGRRCCCTSSTTSCPARRSPGCTARRGRPTRRSPRELERHHRAPRSGALAGDPRRTAPWSSTPRPHAARRGPGRRAVVSAPPTADQADRSAAAHVTVAGDGYVLDNGLVRVDVDGRGLLTSVLDLAAGPGGARPRRRRQPAAAAPRPPQPLGRLGHRRALPRHRHRPRRRRRRSSRRRARPDGVGRRPGRARASARSTRHPDRHAARRAAARLDVDTEVDWHEGEKFLKAAFPLDVHADRSAVGDPVRPRPPADPHQHQLGGGPVRDLRATAGCTSASPATASPWSTTRRTATTSPAPSATGRRHDDHGPALPAARARASPTRRPTRACTGSATRSSSGADIGDATREGYWLNLPVRTAARRRRRRAAGVRRQRRRSWSRRSSSPTTPARTAGDVVVRLYEALGARASGRLALGFPADSVTVTDLLERPLGRRPSRRRRRRPGRPDPPALPDPHGARLSISRRLTGSAFRRTHCCPSTRPSSATRRAPAPHRASPRRRVRAAVLLYLVLSRRLGGAFSLGGAVKG